MAFPEFRPAAMLLRLLAARADFVVIGGMAAIAHGSAQITSDLDICYSRSAENLDRLGEALSDLGAMLRGIDEDVPFVPDGRALRRTVILTLATREGPLDLLPAPDGAPRYDVLRRRALRTRVAGVEVLVASIEDLVAMKHAAGRPRDLIAIEELEVIARLRARARRSPE